MDMVVAATEARRVAFSFSVRVGEHKGQTFSRLLLLAMEYKKWVSQTTHVTSTSQEDGK